MGIVSVTLWNIFRYNLQTVRMRRAKEIASGSRLFSNRACTDPWGSGDGDLPLVESMARRRLLNKLSGTQAQKRRISKKIGDENPFNRDELIQRIGGRRIRQSRHLCSKKTDETGDNELTEADVKDEKWSPVYRFRKIRVYGIISRMKFLQTLGSIMILPYCYYEFLNEQITGGFFALMSGAAITAPLLLIAFTRYFNKIVGVIAINESRTLLRIGHLSYWGGRQNIFIPVDDIVPLTEGAENPSSSLLKLKRYSNEKNFLLISTTNAELCDLESSKQIFGTNDGFICRGAIITDYGEKQNVETKPVTEAKSDDATVPEVKIEGEKTTSRDRPIARSV